mgnify:CR=1 FL=1
MNQSTFIRKAWINLGNRLETERGLRADLARILAKDKAWPGKPRNIETMICRWFQGDLLKTPSLNRAVDVFKALETHDLNKGKIPVEEAL